jgi:hypothetical protein
MYQVRNGLQQKKDYSPGCYPCSLLKVQCSYIATGRGASSSSSEDIHNDNKMWFNMWTTELAQMDIFEECVLILLEQQCLVTQMTWLQLYLMWDWHCDKEDCEKVEEWARMGNIMLERLYKETREVWVRQEMDQRFEEDNYGEGTTTGVERWRAERKEMVRKDKVNIVEIEDSKEHRDV